MIRIRVIVALVVVSILFLSLVYNKFEQSLFADKIESVELQMKNQISTMVTAYEAESKFLLKMAQSLTAEGTRRINWTSMAPYFAVAQLNDRNQLVEWFFRESSPVSSLSKETITQIVRSFSINHESNQVAYQFFQDQDKKRILLTLVPVKDKLWVFVSLGESLQGLMDNQKTLSSALALVNKDLVSVAHVKPEYIGQKIFENAVIKDLRESNKTMSSGSFGITSGEEFFAVMEKVPNMELYLYNQFSLSEIIKSKAEFRRQFAFFSFGFLFILVGILFLLMPKESVKPVAIAPREDVTAKIQISTLSSVSQEKDVSKSAAVVDSSKDRVQNNMKIASAIGHEMKAPLVKILSLVQIGSQTESKAEIYKLLDSVKSQVRSANEVVDKLLLFAGEKEQNKINTKIDTPLLRAIKNLEGLCSQKVVKVSKELAASESFDMDVGQLVTVFENILRNAIQALDRKGSKEIKIKSYSELGKVIVLFEDNGEGIPKEITEKVFDPFFTSMNIIQHMGLGLTVALGIVRQHNGNIRVDSERGRGARIFVEFPVEVVDRSQTALAGLGSSTVAVVPNKPIKPTAPLRAEEEITLVNETDAPVKVAAAPGALNIPKIQDEDVMESISGGSSDEVSVKEKSEEVIVHQNEDNEMFQELNLSTKPISIKPLDLNVDVDELFEVSNDAPKANSTSKVPEAPAVAPAAQEIGAVTTSSVFITKPTEAKTETKSRPSDSFKVNIRKPGRPV